MIYLYEFDIAALLISIILIGFYFQKHQLASLQNRSFLVFLYVLASSSFIEIIFAIIYHFNVSVSIWILWIMQGLFLTLTKSYGVIFAFYCVGLTGILSGKKHELQNLAKVLILLPYIFCLLIIWISPFVCEVYPLAFILSENGQPIMNVNNSWYRMLFAIGGIYILLSIVFVTIERKRLSLTKIVVLYLCAILAFMAVLIQFFIPSIAIESLVLALAALIFFFYMQNPEEVLDGVTRIFNQIAFARITNRYFAKNIPFTCVSVLIDDTVFLSHTFGITQLNNFLKEVASFLSDNFSYDSAFCINQNCFTVIIKNPTEKLVNDVIEKLKTRFQMNWFYDSVELKLYVRECVVECPRCAKKSEDILDILSLVATDERYKQPIVYANEIDLEYKRRNDYIEYALKNGITQNRFDVYYQPIYSTSDKRIIGAEALIRLRDEKGSFLSPEDFIPIAEKSGTILRIGEYVYESVCRTISQIDLEEYGIKKIDINLSVAQCMQEILAEQILSIQSIYQIPASIINLEITETAAAHSPEILLHNMERLAAAGFELSLDDYGSGYSNMNYMLNLPFKMIKIDKYIIWSAFTDERAKKALTATIQMIKSLGMTVLAEGVEDKFQAEMLADLGCDYLQGYYFSRPVQRDEFLVLMKSQLQGKKPEAENEEA
ncbi:MAG: EAL domain-containing protein [Treponema sp.]|nr:EAL domain-containing protein [Treponema sp.]